MREHDFNVGQTVKVLEIPDWLVRDLLQGEREAILARKGAVMVVEDIDGYGYIWLGFGTTVEDEDGATFRGQSFCLPPECVACV